MYTARGYVYYQGVCVLPGGLCTAMGYVYCKGVCVLQGGLYTARGSVYCKRVYVLQGGMYTARGYVYCRGSGVQTFGTFRCFVSIDRMHNTARKTMFLVRVIMTFRKSRFTFKYIQYAQTFKLWIWKTHNIRFIYLDNVHVSKLLLAIWDAHLFYVAFV